MQVHVVRSSSIWELQSLSFESQTSGFPGNLAGSLSSQSEVAHTLSPSPSALPEHTGQEGRSPSQFSSTVLPQISPAPGLIFSSASLQSSPRAQPDP